MSKTKTPEPETKMVETGFIELIVKVLNLLPQNANLIARDVRRTQENCAALRVLDEFAETPIAEYTEVPVEVAN